MTSPRIAGFTHVSLSVSDLERSLAFDRDVLHLPVLAEPYDGTDGIQLELHAMPAEEG